MRAVAAGFAYFFIAFAAGFTLAVPRVLLIEPRLGPLGAVLAEAPLMLAVCWGAAGFVMRRFAPAAGWIERAGVGVLWLVLLWGAEYAVGVWARQLSPAAAFAAFFSGPGLVGVAAQAVCAAFPLLRR
ncbi:MAG: hypothetical protein JNM59_05070 [Hyphomonadaceae bacterium]|nr:hypothetical protein [Hyphomonadaceae bacterium]